MIILSCNEILQTNQYYVISTQDSLRKSKQLPPFPPALPGLKYYSSIVFIFDSTERIHLYQTELRDSNNISLNKSLGQSWCCEEEQYPFFINLEPKDLMTLNVSYFIDFIKDNDTIFKLDRDLNETNKFAFLVSEFDTIKNEGFYKLIDYIENMNKTDRRIFYNVRNATEEERNVLNCKRQGLKYEPYKFQWSEEFLDGCTRPLTKRYDSLENLMPMRIRKKEILKANSLELGRSL
jgi:hypothetical protein